MSTDFIHVESPEMVSIVRLSREAVISSSQLTVKGPLGSGKSHAAEMLIRRSQNRQRGEQDESKTFPWRVVMFHCKRICDPKTRLGDLIRTVHPHEKVSNQRIPYLIDGLASALRRGDPLLLYVDNAHRLDKAELASVFDAVQMARESHRVGLALSTLENQPAFARVLDDPRSLAEIRLLPLKAHEVLCSIQHYDSRFEPWYRAYKDKDREAQDLAKALSDYVDGSFARVTQLCEGLEHHTDSDVLTLAEVRRVIALRTA